MRAVVDYGEGKWAQARAPHHGILVKVKPFSEKISTTSLCKKLKSRVPLIEMLP